MISFSTYPSYYIGFLKNGKPHGIGSFIQKDNSEIHRIWNNGVPVSKVTSSAFYLYKEPKSYENRLINIEIDLNLFSFKNTDALDISNNCLMYT
jgi:hypothetical protein